MNLLKTHYNLQKLVYGLQTNLELDQYFLKVNHEQNNYYTGFFKNIETARHTTEILEPLTNQLDDAQLQNVL